ncbi:MAG: Gfo/Idh/MocA family oxidoreductase [Bacteriovoracia bacterium]
MNETRNILIVGNGPMAQEYAKVFRDGLKYTFDVAGRNRENVQKFAKAERAGQAFLIEELSPQILAKYDFAVSTTSPDSLEYVTEKLIKNGIKAILVEKPAALSPAGSASLARMMKEKFVFARVAYNRRYYRSVQKLKHILREETPMCAHFDFTELSRQIKVGRTQATTERWAIANSCHIIDTVTFLLGQFQIEHLHVSGQNELDWHPASSNFVGSGKCGTTPVSYSTSWLCPGRWSIEIMTKQGRYKLSPIERLQVMRHDSFEWKEVDAGYDIDIQYKPGLMEVVRSFDQARLKNDPTGGSEVCELPDLSQNAKIAELVSKIVGYPV